MTNTNTIPTDQASPELVRLLRARENTYSAAKLTQGLFVAASVVLPVASAFLGKFDELKPYFAVAGLALLFLDVAWLDRLQKDRVKRGAKLQEDFDTKLMKLQWNRFVAGERVSPEDIQIRIRAGVLEPDLDLGHASRPRKEEKRAAW